MPISWARRLALLFVPVVFLTGCIVTPEYVEPVTGDIAYLNISDARGHALIINTYRETQDCTGRSFMRGAIATSFARIRAGGPVAFSLITDLPESRELCITTVILTLQKGRYYRLRLSEDDTMCYGALISSDSEDFSNARREKFRKTDFSKALSEDGSFCHTAQATEVGGEVDLNSLLSKSQGAATTN
jgi:hypothetical protein